MPERVQFVKLGCGGGWFDECARDRVLRLGFWTGEDAMFNACRAHAWDQVRSIVRERRSKETGSVENDVRQIKAVFEDDGSAVWMTVHRRKLYWTKLDLNGGRSRTARWISADDGHVSEHPVTGWSCLDAAGVDLRLDDLAGHVGQLTMYQGTICSPADPDYVLRRIAGQRSEGALKTAASIANLESNIVWMIKQLTPHDFEVLVDMAFSASGWRRFGTLGGTEADIDLLLVRSSIGTGKGEDGEERVAVQVKSQATQKVLKDYATRLGGAYERAFFVFHTGQLDGSQHPGIELIDAARLAPMVLDAGLTRWLLRRVS